MKTLIGSSLGMALMMAAFASPAHGDPIGYGAYVHGYINNADCRNYGASAGASSSCMFAGTDPRFFSSSFYGPVPYQPQTAATATLADGDEFIGASANLATGDLSIQLSSQPSSFYAQVTAVMWDTLTFHFTDTSEHLVTVTMAGGVVASGGACHDPACTNPNATYRLDLFQPPDSTFFPQTLTMAQGVVPLPNNGPYSVSTSMWVHDGMTVGMLAGLSIAGSGPAGGLVFDPLVFALDGGTFTSESGALLTESSAEGVPEPTTLALLAPGLWAAGWRRRRRQR
jgi:hypothetical protein